MGFCADATQSVKHRQVGRGIHHRSGRAIALGRLFLAALFLLAVRLDGGEVAKAPEAALALLIAYFAFAACIAIATWNSWWLDAKLAGPAHAVDILFFIALVFLTSGYASPYFIFFVFLLLAAAVRWGWRETALSAILVTLLYLMSGVLAARSHQAFEVSPFVIRTAQLVVVSLILIWFGVNQARLHSTLRAEELLVDASPDKAPLESALAAAMASLGARKGGMVWRDNRDGELRAFVVRDGSFTQLQLKKPMPPNWIEAPFLYDVERSRGLTRDSDRNLVNVDPRESISGETASKLQLSEGVGINLRLETGEGQLFLEQISDLSTDHVDVSTLIALDVAAHIQRQALLRTAEESAEARSRLSLARDLHDSVVQFLAGAAFRLEGMKRSEASGRTLEPELNELKQLMLEEQGELRSFITALRSGSEVALRDLVRDLHGLADRLSRHWGVECDFAAEAGDMMIPTKLHLDAHQLVREAVANAVRHAGAKSVRIGIAATAEELRLDFINDGAEFPTVGKRIELPQSMKERVEQAGGALDLSRGMKVTKLSISLPFTSGGPA